MFGIMGMDAAFANAARSHKKKEKNIIKIISTIADPSIYALSCSGDITVESIKNGEAVVQTYTDLNETNVSIQADVNTEIKIIGNVTIFEPAGQYQGWGYADTLLAKNIDFNCNTLQSIKVSGKSSYESTSTVESLSFVNCTALQSLQCSNCTGLTSLDLSANTALQYLYCNDCTGLTEIKYPAEEDQPSTSIADAISNATAADGTVYTDSAAAYYSTIANAATAKGWTIGQLQ